MIRDAKNNTHIQPQCGLEGACEVDRVRSLTSRCLRAEPLIGDAVDDLSGRETRVHLGDKRGQHRTKIRAYNPITPHDIHSTI